jgi:hypothetical protein
MVTFYEGSSPEGEGHTPNNEKGRAKAPASPNKTKDNYTKPDTPSTALAALEIDLREAARFLNLLDEGATEFTFQTFDDNADRKDPKLTHILHGTLEEHTETLTRMNNLGAGIYVMVQQGDGRGRRNENVTRIRAVFQEDDGEGRPLPLEPHIVNQSSPGKHHRYLLTDGPSVEEFSAVQERLIADYGSDKNAKDPARVLRLPGFYHQKVDRRKGLTGKPFMVCIVHESGALPYTWEQILEALPPIDRKGTGSHTADEGTVRIDDRTYKALRSALASMRADDRERWVRMGHAFKELGDVGRGLWLEWSQTSLEKYDPRDAAQKWESFKPEHTGYRAVFAEAQRQGWVNPATGEKKEKASPPLPKLTHKDRPERGNGGTFDGAVKEDDPKVEPDTGLPADYIDVSTLDSKSFTKTWLVEDLIEECRTIEFFGTWKSGKSLVVMDMVGHASLGMTWAGQRTVKAVIVWIASEAVDDIERRIRAWRLRHKITGPMPFYIRSVPLYINKAEAAEQLRQEIEAIKSRHTGLPVFLIIDTVAMSLEPGTNENSIEGMGAFVSNLITLVVKPTGATAICIHHSGHGDDSRGRGHSSFEGAIDGSFKVTKEETPRGPETVTVQPKLRRGGTRLDPIHFRIEVQELEGTDNFGKPIAEPVLSYLTEHTQPRKAPFGKHAKTALLILERIFHDSAPKKWP